MAPVGPCGKKGASNPFPLRMLMTPPLMHGAAQWGVLGQLAQGQTVYLLPRFDAEATLAAWLCVARRS